VGRQRHVTFPPAPRLALRSELNPNWWCRYGHVNNVVYYMWMDTAINHFLIESAGFVPTQGFPLCARLSSSPPLTAIADEIVGYCVESGCTFKRSVAFPQAIECGLRLKKLGRTSTSASTRAPICSSCPLLMPSQVWRTRSVSLRRALVTRQQWATSCTFSWIGPRSDPSPFLRAFLLPCQLCRQLLD
jgi:hypothetical protein